VRCQSNPEIDTAKFVNDPQQTDMPRQSNSEIDTAELVNYPQQQADNGPAVSPVSESDVKVEPEDDTESGIKVKSEDDTESVINVEAEDDTDSFVLTPGSGSTRHSSFGTTPDGKSEERPAPTRTLSLGSSDDIQRLIKEYLEESARRSEENLASSKVVVDDLKNIIAEYWKQREVQGKLTIDAAVLYKELEEYRDKVARLYVDLQAAADPAGVDRNVPSLWAILKIWLTRKATANPATPAAPTGPPKFIDAFPAKNTGVADIQAWIDMYLNERNMSSGWTMKISWSENAVRTLNSCHLKGHLKAWGFEAPEHELLAKEIILARRVSGITTDTKE
jgi:hypothetical protein